MTFVELIIGLLTFVLVLTCIVLMLLVLIQMPKKEAGAGIAFGGAAADALFGAGSGNVLTKITKYVSTFFIALSLVLTILFARESQREVIGFEEGLPEPISAPGIPGGDQPLRQQPQEGQPAEQPPVTPPQPQPDQNQQ